MGLIMTLFFTTIVGNWYNLLLVYQWYNNSHNTSLLYKADAHTHVIWQALLVHSACRLITIALDW